MSESSRATLRDAISAGYPANGFIAGLPATVCPENLIRRTALTGPHNELKGRSVLVYARDHFHAALAMVEIDGVARRVVLCPPGVPAEHLSLVIESAEVDAIVSDGNAFPLEIPDSIRVFHCSSELQDANGNRAAEYATEWILLTSGTTGRPKLVVHTLASLTGAIRPGKVLPGAVVWSTFYDIRRYGGLQIFLRAILTGSSLVLAGADEPLAEFLARAGAQRVTHISGTPSHWRRALMHPSARMIAPGYVRLSGEIADQAILDNLRAFYRGARVSHAFASTEAGVAFEVTDGLAGIPANILQDTDGVDMKVENGSLRIRSNRVAERYLQGQEGESEVTPIRDPDGFVDSGDVLELRGDRYYFAGRRDGVINVGGLKVHPEEVEEIINRHPDVAMSLVSGKRSSITGAVVVAEVVPRAEISFCEAMLLDLRREILESCLLALPRHKVPAAIKFVPVLPVAPTGKIVRGHALHNHA
jgi:acyl-CoA synthetase (AMP-forming)/AMP-acid ligase II